MKLGTLISRSALVAASLAMFAGTASAQGILGLPLLKTGDISVAFVGSDADFRDDLWYFSALGDFNSPSVFLFNNHTTAPGTINDFDDSGLAIGAEAIFGICTKEDAGDPGASCENADNVFYSGDATRNTDGEPHMIAWTRAEYEAMTGADLLVDLGIPADYDWVIGFEDILGGGDEDYNDAIFAVRGITAVPEPVTMTLLATGLAGMGGAGAFRRRKNQQ